MPPPPKKNILPTPKIKEFINQCIAIRIEKAHNSVDFGNHRCTNVPNCIILKYKCDKNKFCAVPPLPKNGPTAFDAHSNSHVPACTLNIYPSFTTSNNHGLEAPFIFKLQ